MGKNLYIDASHPDETRIVLKSENHIEEYEYENKNNAPAKKIYIVNLPIVLKKNGTDLSK